MKQLIYLKCCIFFAIMMLSISASKAQTMVNKSQLITILSNTQVSISGGFLNEGIVTNNGSVSVSGDWLNVTEYDPGTGTVILNGENDQIINHNNQVFYNLEVNGSGKKLLRSNITIAQRLNLQKGILFSEKDQYLLLEQRAVVQGGSAESYMNGAFYQTGTGYKNFPVGKDGHYRPVVLENIEGLNPVIGFEVLSKNPYQRHGSMFRSISKTRYWKRTQLEGTYNGSVISLSLGEDDGIKDPELLLIAEMDEAEHVFRSVGQGSLISEDSGLRITSERPSTEEIIAVGIYSGFMDNRVLYVPNVLSHSAINAENRAVKVYGEEIASEEFVFRIYNRWGGLVFECLSYEKASTEGWTGVNILTKEVESNGVFVYTLSGKFLSGVPFKEKGRITILQ